MTNTCSLSHNVALMENIYPGKPVEYTNQMLTAKDSNNNVLVFTHDNFGHLILLQKSQNNTGYIETYLEEGLPKESKITNMAVAQGGRWGDDVIVATVVEKNGVSSIWHTTISTEQLSKIKNDKIKTSSSHTWISKGEFAGKIEQITIGTNKKSEVEVAFSTVSSGKGAVYIFESDKNNKEQLTELSLPEDTTSIADIKLGRHRGLEREDDVNGLLFVLYKIGNAEDDNRMVYIKYPEKTTTLVPVNNATTTFSLAEREGYSEVFAASKNQLYLHENGSSKDATDDDIYTKSTSIGEFDGTIKEVFPTYNDNESKNEKKLECFVLLDAKVGQEGSEVYSMREDTGTTNQWTQPILHRKNVLLMTVGLQGEDGAREVYMYEHATSKAGKDQIVFQRQGDTATDSLWHDNVISVEEQDRQDSYEYKAYMINVKLHDKPDPEVLLDYSKEELKIRCSQNIMIKVNNESIHAGDSDIIGKFNGEGVCKIEVPVNTIDSPLFNIFSEHVYDILRIDPAIHVKEEMDKLTESEDSLKNARLRKPNGSEGDLLVPESSQDSIAPVYEAITALKTVTDKNGMSLLLSPQQYKSKSMDDFGNKIDSSQFTERICLEFDDNAKGGGRTVTYKTLSDEDMAQIYAQKSLDPNSWLSDLIGNVINVIKQGIEKVKQIIVEAVDNGLKLIVEIGNFFWEGIIETLEQVWTFVSTVLEKALNILLDIIMLFFSFLFPWEEIKYTQRALKGIATVSYHRMMNELDSISEKEKIKDAFKYLSDNLFGKKDIMDEIKEGLGDEGNKTIGSISDEHEEQFNEYMNPPQVQWSQNLLMDQMPSTEEEDNKLQIHTLSIKQDLIDKILNALKEFAVDSIQVVTTKFENLIKKIKENPNMTIFDIIEEIFKAVGGAFLEVTGNAFQAVFNIAKAVIEEAWKIITVEIELGWLGRVYKNITKSTKLTILDIMCFVVAAPTTIITKLIAPKAVNMMPESQVKIIEKYAKNENSSLEDLIQELVDNTKKVVEIVITSVLSISSLVMTYISFVIKTVSLVPDFLTGYYPDLMSKVGLVCNAMNGFVNNLLAVWNLFKHSGEPVTMFGSTFVFVFGIVSLFIGFLKDKSLKVLGNIALIVSAVVSALASVVLFGLQVGYPDQSPSIEANIVHLLHNNMKSINSGATGLAGLVKPPPTETTTAIFMVFFGASLVSGATVLHIQLFRIIGSTVNKVDEIITNV